MYNNELYHHGIKGQRWGVRRYQNPDGTLTEAGKKHQTESNQTDSKKKLSTKQKAAIIGATAAGVTLAAYGGYKYSEFVKNKESNNGLTFKRLSKIEDFNTNQQKCNSNFNTDIAFQTNCGGCTLAFEARARGMDVEAMPNLYGMTIPSMGEYLTGLKSDSFLQFGSKIDLSSENESIAVNGEKISSSIKNELSANYPDGSRGCLFVPSGEGSHWISWTIQNGNANFYNPQDPDRNLNSMFGRLKYYRNNTSAEMTAIRLDNLEFNKDNISKVVCNRGKAVKSRQKHSVESKGNNFTFNNTIRTTYVGSKYEE